MKNITLYCCLSLLVCGSIYSRQKLSQEIIPSEIVDYVLITDPKALVKATDSGALTLIQTQTVSSVSSFAFTTGIVPTYNHYLLYIGNLTFDAANTQNLVIQISTDGGSTYIDSGYASGNVGLDVFDYVFDTSIISSGQILLYNLTSNIGYVSSFANLITSYYGSGGAFYNNDGVDGNNAGSYLVNALQILTSDGSTFSGTYSLYGVTE